MCAEDGNEVEEAIRDLMQPILDAKDRRIAELENALRVIASNIDDPEGMSADAVLDLARSVAYEALGMDGALSTFR